MDRRLNRPSVKRCLFGRPTNSDEFLEIQKRREKEEEMRFKREWGFDGVENEIQWSKAVDADIPEFYTRGYSQTCKRRPVRPCVGKHLSFDSDHEDTCEVRETSPVLYCGSSTVEVFIGLLPHQPTEEPVTPEKSDSGDSQTSKSENSASDSDSDVVSSQFLRKNLTQKRLTDMWRALKRTQRSLLTGPYQPHQHKRRRIDRL
ncbi:uncharacterized protein LOC143282763 [Babylonia areolata]|uniref:uncharacterized protein LOC143282763 n=1 Tax=Babylonia areolata TaxID=304850 RepID=UPI003FD13128